MRCPTTSINYDFELALSAVDHASAEGLWPVSVYLNDTGGNVAAVDALGGTMVRADFTPPSAECLLLPFPGPEGYGLGDDLVMVVLPFEALAEAPTLLETCEPECAGPLFVYQPESTYYFSHVVTADEGSFSFEVNVQTTDLVGNVSMEACLGGPVSGVVEAN